MTTPRGSLGRLNSKPLTVRVPSDALESAKRVAATRGEKVSEIVRARILALSVADSEAADVLLIDLLDLLGLDETASEDDILDAVQDVLVSVGAPGDEGEAETTDEAPAAASRASERDRANAKRLGIPVSEFVARKRNAARRSSAAPTAPARAPAPRKVSAPSDRDRANAKRLGITPEEFLARKRNAARRA